MRVDPLRTKAAVLAISDGLRQELVGQVRVTVLLPGLTDTNFAAHVKNPELRAQLEKSAGDFAMSPASVAGAMAFAIDQPENFDTGELVIRSTFRS